MAEPQNEAPVEADLAQVQQTLESMLSKKNLVRDQFLAGNMNPQMYIPIRVLMAHEKMSAIKATEEQMISAATASTRLGIDDAKTMVRPLLKSKRNVIILRDMPENATEEEVKAIFNECPNADKLVSVKAEVNNTWFVKFNLEGTQDVVLWLRSQQFHGQPVNASIKSEHFLRSFFPLNLPAGPPDQGNFGYPMDGGMGGMGFPMGFPPQEMMAEGIGPAGYDFNSMKGDGKGMPMQMGMPMGMQMPEMVMGPQSPGSWQPWGKRLEPPPMILPILYPEKVAVPEGSGDGAEKSDKGKGGDKWGSQKWGSEKWGSSDNKWGNQSWGQSKWGGGKGKGGAGKGGYPQQAEWAKGS